MLNNVVTDNARCLEFWNAPLVAPNFAELANWQARIRF